MRRLWLACLAVCVFQRSVTCSLRGHRASRVCRTVGCVVRSVTKRQVGSVRAARSGVCDVTQPSHDTEWMSEANCRDHPPDLFFPARSWPDVPVLGMVSFVDPSKVRHKRDPGRCYRKAGFQLVGKTAGGLLAWQMLPDAMPEALMPVGAQLLLGTA